MLLHSCSISAQCYLDIWYWMCVVTLMFDRYLVLQLCCYIHVAYELRFCDDPMRCALLTLELLNINTKPYPTTHTLLNCGVCGKHATGWDKAWGYVNKCEWCNSAGMIPTQLRYAKSAPVPNISSSWLQTHLKPNPNPQTNKAES